MAFAGVWVHSNDQDPEFGAIVLDDLRIRYGRDSAVSQPGPSSATIRFVVAEGKLDFTKSPMNKTVIVQISYAGTSRTLFRGEVKDSSAEYWKRRKTDGKRLYLFTIEAVDVLAKLATMSQYERDRPEEMATARLANIYATVQGGYPGVIAGIGGGGGFGPLRAMTLTGSILDQITAVYTSTGEALWYDPATNRMEASGHVDKSSYTTGPLELAADGTRFTITYGGILSRRLDFRANDVELDGAATVDASGDIGKIRATGKLLIYGSGVWQDWWEWAYLGNGGDETLEVESQGYAAQNGTVLNGGTLKATADAWASVAAASTGFSHPPVRAVFKSGFDSKDAVDYFLAGREQREVFSLVSSVYAGLDPEVPLIVRAIGGILTYRSPGGDRPQRWEAEYTVIRVRVGRGSPVTCKTVNPNRTKLVKLSNIDHTVTPANLRFTGTGI
ncbi:hypothetical protein CVCC1112_2620 [Paenarthrobacter nicotinovorans]|nr:hypothetical protein CVCC1112_2620 [Paenarthrobacter nicotinovorans]